MDSMLICKEFIREKLNTEKWFQKLIKDRDCDLLLLTGSAAKNGNDIFSDIDIFLICRNKAQKKHSLRPVYQYTYRNLVIEISLVSTEKLFNDRSNKDNIYWWRGSCIIKSYNKKAEAAFLEASSLSKKDFLDRLWTDFVRFEINNLDIDKLLKRKELLSIRILLHENIKLLIDAVLVQSNEYPQYKWFGGVLRCKNKKLYNTVLSAQKSISDLLKIKKYNSILRLEFVKILKSNNFSQKEINNWESYNLQRITFQYR